MISAYVIATGQFVCCYPWLTTAFVNINGAVEGKAYIMGNPSSDITFGNLTGHHILAEPGMPSSGLVSKVKSIRLTATCPDVMAERWVISFEQLSASLTKILGKATTAELLECPRVGQVITLPGTYNPYEMVRLGYRKTFEPAAGLKRKAGAR